MKTKKVNFEKCEKISTCQYCEFKTICNRWWISWLLNNQLI
jgi:hypothetical protein